MKTMSERSTAEVLAEFDREFTFSCDVEVEGDVIVSTKLEGEIFFPISEIQEIGEELGAVRSRISHSDDFDETSIDWIVDEGEADDG